MSVTITDPIITDSTGQDIVTQLAAISAALAGAFPMPSTSHPLMDGTADAGTSNAWARGDHVHPSDTSRQQAIDSGTISLTTTWSGTGPYTQTATVTGATVTSNSDITLKPTAAQLAQLMTDGVTALLIENNAGILTVYALGAAPTTAITLACTVTELA